MKTLKLTLHKKAFEVMVTGEKKKEFREFSDWITSRLYSFDKEGRKTAKSYDFVEFTNGYGRNMPRFTAKFLGFERRQWVHEKYSNGLVVDAEMLWVIFLGDIISIENYTFPGKP